MKKFWKIYSWIYLAAFLYGTIYHALNPIEIETELTPVKYAIAYSIVSLIWLIPVIGIFLYSFNKRKFIIFWRLFFVYFVYSFTIQLIEIFKIGGIHLLFPFHAIALVGLFLYSFTNK